MKKSKNFIKATVFIVIMLTLILIISLPIFTIDTINILGTKSITNENILLSTGLNDNPNFFFFSSKKAKKEIKNNPYIEEVSINKIFPSSVSIQVKEREIAAYIEDKGNYIYIDNDGRVLDISRSFTERLPVIVGLDFDSYSLGEILDVEGKSSFKAVVMLSNLFSAYNLEDEIIRVDINDENDIHLFIYNMDVSFGGISGANEKIKNLKGILEDWPEAKTARGYLNLEEPYTGYAARWRYMT